MNNNDAGRPRLMHHHMADEIKRNEMNGTSMEKWWNKVVAGGKEQTQRNTYLGTFGVTETRTRDTSGECRVTNRLHHWAAPILKINKYRQLVSDTGSGQGMR